MKSEEEKENKTKIHAYQAKLGLRRIFGLF